MREEGYYWVQFDINSRFIVAEYLENYQEWLVPGGTHYFKDEDFYYIDEKEIEKYEN